VRVVWEEEALHDLEEIYAYIAQDNPGAAAETAMRITEAVGCLGEAPGMGRPGRVPNTRELVVSGTPYLVPYRAKRLEVQVLRVFHTSQRAEGKW
jgi:addiction module RelE/StbE family toxin